MSANAVQPGARIIQRYLLEEIVGEAGGSAYWRAQDELLDRPVGVCLLSSEPGRAEQILGAARRAAVVTDPRFLRILDASESDGVVYVVNEWVRASSLADLLNDGPLSPGDAHALALEIAEALASAHSEGLAHLCLEPEKVLRTAHGQVKISGLGVDAAVRAVAVADPAEAARVDVRGCAAILYAALTGRWPAEDPVALPPAPRENGELCSPRQVRAGIPSVLDELTCRALAAQLRDPGQAVDTPDELARLLAAARPPETARGSSHAAEETQAIRPGYTSPATGTAPTYAAPYDDVRRRPALATTAWVVVGLVLLVGLGLVGYQLTTGGFGSGSPGRNAGDGTPTATGNKTGTPLTVAAVDTLDPPPGGNGEENTARAGRVIDGDATTEWTTKTYKDPFGPSGLKDGVGLVLDLGDKREVSSVQVVLGGGPTDLELRTADEPREAPDDYRVAAEVADKSGSTVLRPEKPVEARYLLLWFTSLPPVGASEYRGRVAEVVVRG